MSAARCWAVGALLIFILASFCLWNCLTREDVGDSSDWYGCRDQNGNPVDLFVVYKLPREKASKFPLIEEGTAYMYLTPGSSSRLQSGGVSSVFSYSESTSSWVMSNISINSELSMPARTLRRLYFDPNIKETAAYIMYNDEFPDGSKSFSKGHTKGIVVMTPSGGYWLIHSVPKYPPNTPDGYSYPSSGHHYGQTMLCISLPVSEADNIGTQLIYNNPYIYESNMPKKLSGMLPVLKQVIDGEHPTKEPYFRITTLTSMGKKAFTSFAKYRKYTKDLYSGLVAPTLQTNINVETWRNGPGPLPSTCNETYKVENIEKISSRTGSIDWSVHADHSKWAVATNPDKPFICIGDINRMATQFKRPGGTVCLSSLSIWHRFHSLISEVDNCPRLN